MLYVEGFFCLFNYVLCAIINNKVLKLSSFRKGWSFGYPFFFFEDISLFELPWEKELPLGLGIGTWKKFWVAWVIVLFRDHCICLHNG